MSNVIVKGWDWLETEIHKALSFAHLTNTTQDFPVAAKAAVSAVLQIAKDEALAQIEPVLVTAESAINGQIASSLGAPVADIAKGVEDAVVAATIRTLQEAPAPEQTTLSLTPAEAPAIVDQDTAPVGKE